MAWAFARTIPPSIAASTRLARALRGLRLVRSPPAARRASPASGQTPRRTPVAMNRGAARFQSHGGKGATLGKIAVLQLPGEAFDDRAYAGGHVRAASLKRCRKRPIDKSLGFAQSIGRQLLLAARKMEIERTAGAAASARI